VCVCVRARAPFSSCIDSAIIEVPTVLTVKVQSSGMTACFLVNVCRRSEITRCLHLQDRRIKIRLDVFDHKQDVTEKTASNFI
jgi:hypothetical protein